MWPDLSYGVWVRLKDTMYCIFLLSGGRSCLGKYLARMELFIFIGTLLQRFEFKPPPGVKRLSDRRIQSGVVVRPEDSELCAIPLE